MNYELLKKLKDAGYHLKCELDGFQGAEKFIPPTLEELIEACGEGINRIWRVDETYDRGKTKWCATGTNDFNDGLGQTPTEAVTNLWLKLHE